MRLERLFLAYCAVGLYLVPAPSQASPVRDEPSPCALLVADLAAEPEEPVLAASDSSTVSAPALPLDASSMWTAKDLSDLQAILDRGKRVQVSSPGGALEARRVRVRHEGVELFVASSSASGGTTTIPWSDVKALSILQRGPNPMQGDGSQMAALIVAVPLAVISVVVGVRSGTWAGLRTYLYGALGAAVVISTAGEFMREDHWMPVYSGGVLRLPPAAR